MAGLLERHPVVGLVGARRVGKSTLARMIARRSKRTSSPRVTPSMRHALADLRLRRLEVLHAGESTFPLAPKIRALSVTHLLTELQPLR